MCRPLVHLLTGIFITIVPKPKSRYDHEGYQNHYHKHHKMSISSSARKKKGVPYLCQIPEAKHLKKNHRIAIFLTF